MNLAEVDITQAADVSMSDQELATFLGLDGCDHEKVARIIAALTPERRAVYDKMRAVELWDRGFGPLPKDVIICRDQKQCAVRRRRKSR